MPITTPWVTTEPSWYGNSTDPALGNGTLRFRSRRASGEFQWGVQLITGSSTTYGSGAWAFLLSTDLAFPIAAGFGACPGTATALSDATTVVASGAAQLFLTDGSSLGLPGIWAQAEQLFMRVIFDTSLASSSVPVSWGSGYRLLCGNSVEAFDN